MYTAVFDEEWPCFFNKLDYELQERTAKKIMKILLHPQKRHMKKGARFFVDQIGQCRVAYRVFEESRQVKFYFIGCHKEYEKWFRQFF